MATDDRALVEWSNTLIDLVSNDADAAVEHLAKGQATLEAIMKKGLRLGTEMAVVKARLWTKDCGEAKRFFDAASARKLVAVNEFELALAGVMHEALEQGEDFSDVAQAQVDFATKRKLHCAHRLSLFFRLSQPGTREAACAEADQVLAENKDVELARACCFSCIRAKDLGHAATYLPLLKAQLNWAEWKHREEFVLLLKSPFAKAASGPLSKDPVIAKAAERATLAPWDSFTKLEKHREKTKDLVALLAVETFCLHVICEDLGEHGDANLDDYGAPKQSPASLKKLLAASRKALTAEAKRAKAKLPAAWKHVSWEALLELLSSRRS